MLSSYPTKSLRTLAHLPCDKCIHYFPNEVPKLIFKRNLDRYGHICVFQLDGIDTNTYLYVFTDTFIMFDRLI